MYYLVDAEVFHTTDASGSECEKIQRLVEASDKDEAWDKMKEYLDNIYGTENFYTFRIHVNDTIL